MAYGIKNSEIRKIVSLVMMGVFSGLIIIEARDWLVQQFGNPLIVGIIGLVFAAYIFNIK